jgi:hypothetical protein
MNSYCGYSQGLSLRIIIMTNMPRHHFFVGRTDMRLKKDGDVAKGYKTGWVYVLSVCVFTAL